MKKLHSLLLATLFCVSCAHPTRVSQVQSKTQNKEVQRSDENPVTEESILQPDIENQFGEAIGGWVLLKYKLLLTSKDFENYANEIAKNIGMNSHRSELHYQVSIVDSKEFIAAGLPGGRILISKAFLDIIQNESEFANLISNQIAHIAKQDLINVVMENCSYAHELQDGKISDRIVHQAAFELFDQGYDYDVINEADRLAPTYAMHVGYDVHAFESLLQNTLKKMDRNHHYGFGDWNSDPINHRVSMNQVFVKSLEKTDFSKFPKSQDRYKGMLKKIAPPKQPTKIAAPKK